MICVVRYALFVSQYAISATGAVLVVTIVTGKMMSDARCYSPGCKYSYEHLHKYYITCCIAYTHGGNVSRCEIVRGLAFN